jgi:hypothetical protein
VSQHFWDRPVLLEVPPYLLEQLLSGNMMGKNFKALTSPNLLFRFSISL